MTIVDDVLSLWLLGRITARYPISANTAEQGLLVFPDPPHIVKVFRESEAHGVGEEVGEHSSEAREDTVGDEGGPVPVEILRERLREVAAHLVANCDFPVIEIKILSPKAQVSLQQLRRTSWLRGQWL